MSDYDRKIILDLAVSLDGFIEGKNGETDWCIMDPDMKFLEFLNDIDTIFYGRKSYESWGLYEPTDTDSPHDRELWRRVHSKEKIVFSQTMKEDIAVRVISDDLPAEILRIKNRPGKNIWLYGGSSLISTFMNLNLIDEFRLSVHPILLGEGKPLFGTYPERVKLLLADTHAYPSGVVQLIYHRNG